MTTASVSNAAVQQNRIAREMSCSSLKGDKRDWPAEHWTPSTSVHPSSVPYQLDSFGMFDEGVSNTVRARPILIIM